MEILFKDTSRLIISKQSIYDTYDYSLTLIRKNLFPNLIHNTVSENGDIYCEQNEISFFYNDRNNEFHNIKNILEAFNYFNKKARVWRSIGNRNELEWKETPDIENIPILKFENIENIYFRSD